MSDILAAFLCAQLERYEQIAASRRRIWEAYYGGLSGWAAQTGVQLPFVPPHCEQPFHMFYLVMPSLAARAALIAHLKSFGILSVFHYIPLHLSTMGVGFGGRPGQCPIAERVSDCLVRLPFYNELSEQQQSEVVDAILKFKPPEASQR